MKTDYLFLKKLVRILKDIEFDWVISPPSASLFNNGHITTSEMSVALGQISVINNARLNGYNKIAIWEDDGVLTATSNEIKSFIDEIPDKWDFLYLGNANWTDKFWPPIVKEYSLHVNKVYRANGCSFIGINSQIYNEILFKLNKLDRASDFKFNDLYERGNTYGPKKYFSNTISIPHEKIRHTFSEENLKKFIPSYISHTL